MLSNISKLFLMLRYSSISQISYLLLARNLISALPNDNLFSTDTYQLTTYRTSVFSKSVIENKELTTTLLQAYIELRVMSVKADLCTPNYGGVFGIDFSLNIKGC